MHQTTRIFSLLVPFGFVLVACSDPSTPANPSGYRRSLTLRLAGGVVAQATSDGNRQIVMIDQCDPDSFNAVIPARHMRRPKRRSDVRCVHRAAPEARTGAFLALLPEHDSCAQRADARRHEPGRRSAYVHRSRGVRRRHCADFNALSGTPVPAPECLALGPGDFIAAGGQTSHTFERGEADKYQCCIHPWMRAVTR